MCGGSGNIRFWILIHDQYFVEFFNGFFWIITLYQCLNCIFYKINNYLKAYFVYGNDSDYSKTTRIKELEKIGTELHLKNIALTFVPSFSDTESEANLNKINPDVENTFIVYKHRNIVEKFIDLKPTAKNFQTLSTVLDKTKGKYFDLKEPAYLR